MTTPRKTSAGQSSALRTEAPQCVPEHRSGAKHLRLGIVNPLLARASRVARGRVELSRDALAAGIDCRPAHVSLSENGDEPESFGLAHLGAALRSEGAIREWGVDMLRSLCALAGGRFELTAVPDDSCTARLARILRDAGEVTAAIVERCADGINELSELEHEQRKTQELMAQLSKHEAFLARAIASARGLR